MYRWNLGGLKPGFVSPQAISHAMETVYYVELSCQALRAQSLIALCSIPSSRPMLTPKGVNVQFVSNVESSIDVV